MKVLGIETSCDEAGVALIDGSGVLLAQGLASHAELCVPHGGVFPEVIAREHARILPGLVKQTLKDFSWQDVDVIAVTSGPGLVSSLLVGCAFARGLSRSLQCPLYGINHLQAHVLVASMENDVRYPFLALLISGGHTTLYLVKNPVTFLPIGSTNDDAVGEAFDKVARMLGFPYPGGVHIERVSKQGQPCIDFPKPMIYHDNLDFSFSGLKASVARYLEKNTLTEELKAHVACSFQESVASIFAAKITKALEQYPEAKSVVMTGGVAANQRLREAVRSVLPGNLPLFCPKPRLCTDNGVMIAWAARELYSYGALQKNYDVVANPNMRL